MKSLATLLPNVLFPVSSLKLIFATVLMRSFTGLLQCVYCSESLKFCKHPGIDNNIIIIYDPGSYLC